MGRLDSPTSRQSDIPLVRHPISPTTGNLFRQSDKVVGLLRCRTIETYRQSDNLTSQQSDIPIVRHLVSPTICRTIETSRWSDISLVRQFVGLSRRLVGPTSRQSDKFVGLSRRLVGPTSRQSDISLVRQYVRNKKNYDGSFNSFRYPHLPPRAGGEIRSPGVEHDFFFKSPHPRARNFSKSPHLRADFLFENRFFVSISFIFVD